VQSGEQTYNTVMGPGLVITHCCSVRRDPITATPELVHMKHQKKQFAICVRNEGAEDLEIRKVYQILPDTRAAKEKHVRVIDESGEDYLYPADYFIPLTLPLEVERALSGAPR